MTQTPERTTPPTPPAAIDEGKLEAFLGQVVHEVGAAYNTVLTAIGDELGLYQVLAQAGPLSSTELAARSGTLSATCGSGPTRRRRAGSCATTPRPRPTNCRRSRRSCWPTTPARSIWPGIFQGVPAVVEHDPAHRGGLPHRTGSGLARARPPAVRGHRAVLPVGLPREPGLRVDSGPGGRGGQAAGRYPPSPMSAAVTARRRSCSRRPTRTRRSWATTTTRRRSTPRAQRAADAGLPADRVRFEVAGADDYPAPTTSSPSSTLSTTWATPLAVARHVRESLTPDGTFMLFEPAAGDTVSATTSTPSAGCTTRSPPWSAPRRRWPSPGARPSGAQAGPARLGEILAEAGFTRVREAARTPFNIVLEARP